MTRFIARRLLLLVPTLIGVSLLVFSMIHLTPGDPATVMLGERASPKAVADLRAQLGLDENLAVQYVRFLAGAAVLDFGRSIKTNEPVRSEIAAHFPATFELTLAAMILGTLTGLAAGIVSAVRSRTVLDYAAMTGALAGVSMPIFWLALVLILVFAVFLDWFPVSGRLSAGVDVPSVTRLYLVDTLLARDFAAWKDAAWHLVLPAVTLATLPMAVVARMTRSSLLEVLRQDYIRTARAKGLAERVVILRHGLRNALIPVLTVGGLQFGLLLGGAILTETIYSWPGIGRWILHGVYARDFRAVQGGVMVVAAAFVLINLIVDVLYHVVDPRLRKGSGA